MNRVDTTEQQRESSFIGEKMEIRGEVLCRGELVIAGRVEGRLRAKRVRLLASGQIHGKMACQRLLCSGRLEGVALAGKGTFSATAEQYGKIQMKALELEQGARYDCLIPYIPSR